MKDLIVNHENIMKYWNYDKNKEYDLNKIGIGSHESYYWKCPICKHEWKTRVGRLVNETKGCPNCKKNNNKMEHTLNVGLICNETQLMKEWDYNTNSMDGLDPTKLSRKSRVKANWICLKKKHKWKSSIYNRVIHHRNCPYCTNQKILKGYNDLVTVDPQLASEWDYERNKIKPTQIGAGAREKYWWRCEKGHEWLASPSSRHRLNVGCPYCSQSISFPEKAIFFYLKKYIKSIVPNYRSSIINNKEIDIYLPEEKVGIEYDGLVFHNEKKDKEKDKICKKIGIKIIHVAEKNKSEVKIVDNYIYYNPTRKSDLNLIINFLLNQLLKTNNIDYEIDVEKDLNKIYRLIEKHNKEKALFNTNPELKKIWNFEKNNGLNPDLFSKGSKLDVWWKCENGHEWKATISNVSKGSRCPFCSGRLAIRGENDIATLRPLLIDYWDKSKNKEYTPYNLKIKSNKKIWWKCPKCGNQWNESVATISKKTHICSKCGD